MDETNLPESLLVPNEDEAGFIDLNLYLVRLEIMPNGGFFAEGRGKHGNRTLGFAIELDSNWKATPIPESNDFFYWGSGVIRSTGNESDALLAILTDLYNLPLCPMPMRKEISVGVVGLANDPRLLLEKPTHMKLFFENGNPDRYAEVFVNVIASERRMELHEKDPEYRKALVCALSDEAG